MNKTVATAGPAPAQTGFIKTGILCLPMAVIILLMLTGGRMPAGGDRLFALAVAFVFFNTIFFLMIRTGKTDRWRSILFVTYAVCFVVSFISRLVEGRGSMALSEADMIEGLTPFCHIVIPMTLIPAALTKTIIFPGTIIGGFASIASMFVLWIGSSLALGRGFCSWLCFFGGLDDGFARIFKKPIIKNIDVKWTYLPYAVLLLVVLGAALTLTPVYCEWLCPYKTVTEFAEITSLKTLVQTIIFVSLFIALVVVLPLLTKRRIQCSLFCPFGPFQSFTNKINVFDVRLDREKCMECGKCVGICPTFSIDDDTIARGKTGITCMKCGKCIDACPKGALFFHVRGTPLSGGFENYRRLFLYPAFLFLATMAGGPIQDTIVRIMKLISTGYMI